MNASRLFKILTFIILQLGIIFPAHSVIVSQENFKTHLRLAIDVDKSQVQINKEDTSLRIKTLDKNLFNQISEDLSKININKNYFSDLSYLPSNKDGVNEVKISLKDDSIELFSFYKEKESEYVLDFWINQDLVVTKKAAVQKKPKIVKVAAAPKPKKKTPVKKSQKVEKKITASMEVVDPEKIMSNHGHKGYRDFRYGASDIWDYKAFIPPLESSVNLKIKAPDYFFEIKDREFSDADKKEAHLQLSINFYKDEKWGLMTRSIDLYEKKYGKDKYRELHDFMKATSMIKNIIKKTIKPDMGKPIPILNKDGEQIGVQDPVSASDKGVFAAAMSLLRNVIDRTSDYELKRACMQYILQYNLDNKDYIKAMQSAKELYVAATEQFDDEMIIRSSRVILYSLAHLKQVKKMKEFLSNKAVIRVLPAQEGDAYIGYVNLLNKDLGLVISSYEANKKSYTKPVHPSILFNTAEAYFRQAKYEKAIDLFDAFTAQYSYTDVAGNAFLRIALGYDLLDKDPAKVLKLYETAINKSVNPKVRVEAKIRYVGYRVARKLNIDSSDLETLSFLDSTQIEKKAMEREERKLLWLVRLRSMLAQEKYDDALAYLSSIPLDTMSTIERRTYNADGAEVVLGLIKKAYLAEDYSRAVKVWEVFKNKYNDKVAASPYLRFIVADSFLKLGLNQSHSVAFEELKKMKGGQVRTFPKWVKIHKDLSIDEYVGELELTKALVSKDWKLLDRLLEEGKTRKNVNYNYYKGLVSFHNKEYDKAVSHFESLLVKPNLKNILNPNQSLEMLTTYSEALFQSNDQVRFRKNAMALVGDLRKNSSPKYQSAIERIEYLIIESISSEGKVNYENLHTRSVEFLNEYKKTTYRDRVRLLNGIALINTSRVDEGKQLLEDLVNANETPEYIKGLARSELSSLVLRNKKL
jgi:outer membrane protein assembly factor BamD (BamD/ComL family)